METFLGVAEVAELLGCSVSTIKRAANAGLLKGIRIGKKRGPRSGGRERLFSRLEVERFLSERNAKLDANKSAAIKIK